MDVLTRAEGPRPFRSRRDRPCDACRGRKIACRIDTAPPCAFCTGRGSPCTFENGPSSKRRKVLPPSSNGHHLQIETFASFSPSWDDFVSEQFDSTIFDTLELAEDESPISLNQAESSRSRPDGQVSSTSPQQSRFQGPRRPTETPGQLGTNSLGRWQVPPDTGHLSRHVTYALMLGREHIDLAHVQLRRTSTTQDPNASSGTAPILALKEHTPPLLVGALSNSPPAWSDVEALLSERQRHELIQLYFHFVQPAFPVLKQVAPADRANREAFDFGPASIALSSCVYATALPFSIHNDYLNATLTDAGDRRDVLYGISIAAILAEVNSPSLETLQACLLLLQKGPTIQHQGLTPAYACFASVAVTIAKSLGLQYDCSSWDPEIAEQRLRHRLWWATFIVDIWISIDTPGGRSIRNDEFDVLLPRQLNMTADELSAQAEEPHFTCLVELSHLLSQICDTYYTVRATKELGSDLFKSLELAKPLRSNLNDCKQSLKTIPLTGSTEPGASGSVHLAGCVVSIILFRALLRPLQCSTVDTAPSGNVQQSAATAIMTGSINSAKEVVELLETMVSTVGPWSQFWHSFSQGNFTIVSSFLVQLMQMSYLMEGGDTEVTALISRWKRAIRIGAGSGGWGSSLMSMALSKLDSFLSCGDE
jgi:hypothetical protein